MFIQGSEFHSTLGSKCQTDGLGLNEHEASLRRLSCVCVCVCFPFFAAATRTSAWLQQKSRRPAPFIWDHPCSDPTSKRRQCCYTFFTRDISCTKTSTPTFLASDNINISPHTLILRNKSSGRWERGEKLCVYDIGKARNAWIESRTAKKRNFQHCQSK